MCKWGRAFAFIGTIPKPLNTVFLSSAVLLLIKVLVLNKIKAPTVVLFELGKISEAVLLSVVASYFFYIITVHISYFNTNTSRCSYVIDKVDDIVRSCSEIIDAFSKSGSGNCDLDMMHLDKDTLASCLKGINPKTESPLMIPNDKKGFKYALWYEFFTVEGKRTINSIDKLLDISLTTELGEDMLSALRDIKECPFYKLVILITLTGSVNTDIAFLAKEICDYVRLVVELKGIKENYQKVWKLGS